MLLESRLADTSLSRISAASDSKSTNIIIIDKLKAAGLLLSLFTVETITKSDTRSIARH